MPLECRLVGNCWTAVFRTKSPNVPVSDERLSGFLDLVRLGLGTHLALAVMLVCCQVMASVAGPALILSLMLSAAAAFCSGVCYAELRCHWTRVVGTAYDYIYFSVGEGVAFLVGWSLLLQHVTVSAVIARSISANMDALLGFHIHNLTVQHLGRIDKLDSYPDFLAGFVLIIAIAIVAVGVRQPPQIPSYTTAALLLVVTFALIISLFHLDFHLWSTASLFFPHGLSGILEGAGSVFIIFTSFDTVLRHSDFIGRPGHRSLHAVVVSFAVLIVFSVAVTSASSLLASFQELQTEAPLVESFEQAGITWVKYVVSTSGVLILASTLVSFLSEASDFVEKLSKDGMLFSCLLWTSKDDDTPVFTAVFPGIVAIVLSIVLSATDLIKLASISALLVYSCSVAVLMCLRYTPPSVLTRAAREERKRKREDRRRQQQVMRTGSSGYGTTSSVMTPSSPTHLMPSVTSHTTQVDLPPGEDIEEALGLAMDSPAVLNSDSESDIDEAVEEYKEKLRARALTTCSLGTSRQELPTEVTHKRACLATMSFCLWVLCLSAILHRGSDALKDGSIVLIMLVVVCLLLILASVVMLARQPSDVIEPCDVPISVPQFPWMTLTTLVLDLHLMVSLAARCWLLLFIWMVSGLLVYVFYGVRHSRAANLYNFLPEEHQGLIPSSYRQQTSSNNESPVTDGPDSDLQEYQDSFEEDTALIE